MAGLAAHITNRDVRAAQALLDELVAAGVLPDNGMRDGQSTFMHARGMVATWAADLREAGYDEGVQVGRRQVANGVLDYLSGEGLV